jgi:hypothetical protein
MRRRLRPQFVHGDGNRTGPSILSLDRPNLAENCTEQAVKFEEICYSTFSPDRNSKIETF